MADDIAQRLGCDVWIPDYFDGRPLFPLVKMVIPEQPGIKITFRGWLKIIRVVTPQLLNIFLSRESVVDRRLESFIKLLKEKKGYKKLGAVGYCFGGSTGVRFASKGLLESVVINHPGSFPISKARAINIPNSWVCAEEDITFTDRLRRATEEEMALRKGKENEVEFEFRIYKGTAHGFASRPNFELPDIQEAWVGALDQTVEWFKKTAVVDS